MSPHRHAVETALKDNWSRLFGYALTLAGDRDAGRDLLQQAAVNALSSHQMPEDADGARAWLFTIVRHAWIDRYRREQTRADAAESDQTQATWQFDDSMIAEITVRQCLQRIEPSHREIIQLVDLWGFKYAEVAKILDIPIGTVMSRLSRARLSLLEALSQGNVTAMTARRK